MYLINNKRNNMDSIHNITEASKLLGYNRRTLTRKIKAGEINGFKIGSRWFLKESEIKRLRGEL